MGLSYCAVSPCRPLIPDIYIQTDASGSWSRGSFFLGKWLQWEWPNKWLSSNIMAKELVPIVLSCAVWGPELTKHVVCVQCDNSSVVAAIKKVLLETAQSCSYGGVFGSS